MCGRYALYDTNALASRYNVAIQEEIEATYNAAPTQIMPVITQQGAELMHWGLIPRWSHDSRIAYKLINARAESVFDKPIWKNVITRQRCLVPANGFYEWQKRPGGKQPFFIHPKDVPIFSFAGVWERWQHEGAEWHTYSIITIEANDEMSPIHDRMPVILHPDDEAQYLQADTREDVEPLLAPYPDGDLEMYEVSTAVNGVKVNDRTLIGPLNSK